MRATIGSIWRRVAMATVACGALGMASGAYADTSAANPAPAPANANAAPAQDQDAAAPAAFPAAGGPATRQSASGDLFDFSNLGKDFGDRLAAKGVYLRGSVLSTLMGNVEGGRERGSSVTTQLIAGADFDMEKIAGIPGGSLHVTLGDRSGPLEGKFTGSYFIEPNSYGPIHYDSFHLSQFTWWQNLFDNRVSIELGRTQWSPNFSTSDLYFQFVGWETTDVPALPINVSASLYDVGYWGGRVILRPTKPIYLMIGAYEDNPYNALPNQQGFPGKDWTFDGATGEMIPVELGYNRNDFKTERLPFSYDVGYMYDSSTYNDLLYNRQGQLIPTHGGVAQPHSGRGTVYWQGQQTLWRPDMNSRRSIEVFASGAYGVQGETIIKDTWQAGVVARGLFKARPNDTINFVADFYQYNPRLSQAENLRLTLAGLPGSMQRDETFLELNYGYEAAPGIVLRPFAQYIAHPEQFSLTPTDPKDTHATVVGLQLSLQLGQALGLPAWKP